MYFSPFREATYLNPLDSIFENDQINTLPLWIMLKHSLSVHFINPSDQVVVIPKHRYVGAMEKVLESNQCPNLSNIPPDSFS